MLEDTNASYVDALSSLIAQDGGEQIVVVTAARLGEFAGGYLDPNDGEGMENIAKGVTDEFKDGPQSQYDYLVMYSGAHAQCFVAVCRRYLEELQRP